MNPIALLHVILGLLIIALSLPLVKRKVKMNRWYGVRIPESFASEERWFDINQYGGRLFVRWGLCIMTVGAIGAPLQKTYWKIYSFSSLAIIGGGLALVVILIFRYAAKTKRN